ncbi:MAG TPA: BTAD domain-containing putative transcriptional regulator [Blastocatellia bacterium]|nr:BTAD domain-containing putative transcriptional regulator [Blastocatellia bacterium]
MTSRVSIPGVLEVHLLGPFRLAVDGSAVEQRRWSRRKPKLLVKLLALQPHHQLHREQVMECLWPGLGAEAAANNLHKSIHAARRALEPGLKTGSDSHFILTHGQQILLSAPERLWIDVEAFERAAADAIRSKDEESCQAALALYSGDLLAEDPYEEWAVSQRERLRVQHQSLLFKLAELYRSRGDYQSSIERFKELLVCDAANEEAHRQLMRLYALTGNKRQALRQYELCSAALRKELDAEPERATLELRQQIISGRFAPLASSGEIGPGPDTVQAINSIAILPFINASADPNAEYLCGINENIINSLSQLSRLRVMAYSTVSHYKGRDPREIGHVLNVQTVLTGRVLRLRDDLLIRTELVDVTTGAQLWGEQYNRKLSDIIALQEEISRDISEKLRLKLTREEEVRLTRRYTDDAEAYQLFLKGRYFWNKRTGEVLKKSIEYFRQAIAKDPNYAAAYAGMSDSYTILVVRHGLAPEDGLVNVFACEGAIFLPLKDQNPHASPVKGTSLEDHDQIWY